MPVKRQARGEGLTTGDRVQTLHVISHTHWDREWYLTFQQFRLKLVHMIDKLLDILDEDPEYRYFMLDGQTIVLDDYLQMRPEKEAVLRAHIESGRILIGPWHILSDISGQPRGADPQPARGWAYGQQVRPEDASRVQP